MIMLGIPRPARRKWSLSRCQVWLERLTMTQGFHAVPSEAVLLMWAVASVALAQGHQISNPCLPGSRFQLINKACHHKTGLTRKDHLLVPFLS